jgi:hypothetical protein
VRKVPLSVLLVMLGVHAPLLLVPSTSAADEPAASPEAVAPPAAAPAAAAGAHVFKPPPGYKTKTRGTETVYCVSRASVGTRLKTEQCYTEAQLDAVGKAMRELQEDAQQRGRMCNGGAMCAGG